MKDIKSKVITTSLVLVPPIIGSVWYLAPFKNGFGFFWSNYFFVASVSLVWWPAVLFLKKRTFIAGLLGMHLMMGYFLYGMYRHWGDDLGWILYFPNLFIGLVAGILISWIATKINRRIQNEFRDDASKPIT